MAPPSYAQIRRRRWHICVLTPPSRAVHGTHVPLSLPAAAAGALFRATATRLVRELAPADRVAHYLTPELCLALLAGGIGSAPIVPVLGRWHAAITGRGRRLGLDAAATVALMAVFAASLLQVAARTYNPFIYFRF